MLTRRTARKNELGANIEIVCRVQELSLSEQRSILAMLRALSERGDPSERVARYRFHCAGLGVAEDPMAIDILLNGVTA